MDILSSLQNTGNIFRKPELTWGVLGTARIAERAIIPALKEVRRNRLAAVGSRTLAKANDFAVRLEIPKAYGSYEEVLADDEIDAVYIPLPNSEHKPWAIKALEAGKHVLVEKPIALSADEAQEMVSVALEKQLVLMEAFMYRNSARFERVVDLVKREEIGKLRSMEASFSFNLTNPDDIRLIPDLGGGALYDVGCYAVNILRLLAGREPEAVQAYAHMGGTGVDLQVVGSMDFGGELFGQFSAGFNSNYQQNLRLIGTAGTFQVGDIFNPHGSAVKGELVRAEESKNINFKAENDYKGLLEHFYDVVISKESPKFPLSDSVKNMTVIDAIFQSIADGGRSVRLQ